MLFKKITAGLIGVLFIACLGQALFIFHFRDFAQFSRLMPGSADVAYQEKTEFKDDTPAPMPAPLLAQGEGGANLAVPEAFRAAVHDHFQAPTLPPVAAAASEKVEVPLLLTKTTSLNFEPVSGSAQAKNENALTLPPVVEKFSAPPALASVKDSEFPSLPAAKWAGGLPTAPSTAEPPAFPGAAAQPPAVGALSLPPLDAPPKPEDPASKLARVHKELAELMSPEELQKAVVTATAQLEERKKRKEKERKEQAALTALEKAKTALKQISSEYPDTAAGQKAAQFLKGLENQLPPLLSPFPANPTALEVVPLVLMSLSR